MSTRWMNLFCVAASMLALVTASQARAEACDASDACPKGFKCENYGAPGCAQPAICELSDAGGCRAQDAGPCDTKEIKECVPADCKADTDCADGMLCFTQSYDECPGGTDVACADGQECPKSEPAPCTTKTVSTCTPRYLLPCTDAASCGEGFTCEAAEECACAGNAGGSSSGGSDPGAGGAAASPAQDAGTTKAQDAGIVDPDCTCTPTGEKYCKAEEIVCTTASDCPTDWTCEAQGSSGGAVCSTSRDFSVDGGATTTEDAGLGNNCQPIEPTVAESRCMPPYSDLYARADATGTGKGGGTALGSAEDDGNNQTTSGADQGADAGAGSSGSDDSGGICSVAQVRGASARQTTSWLVTLGLLGMALVSRRRSRAAR